MYSPRISEFEERISKLLTIDKIQLEKLLRRIRKNNHSESSFDSVLQKIKSAEKRCLKKTADELEFSYPELLPISSRVEDIKDSLKNNQVVIICGSTGSGKTTQLPKVALDLGMGRFGRIGCTQPRRLAATAMARRVASELKVQCGEQVGFQVRFNKRVKESTVIKFMTDGVLLSETQSDPDLLQYDTIIVDEAHERSLNIDFILGYLKQLQQRRPELKIIISSATLDAENFSEFFDGAPILTIEGRTFPVDDYFLPPHRNEELAKHICRAVEWISEIDNNGDVLVFLPGEREIRDAADMLQGRNIPETEILPLFGRLSMNEQQRIFAAGAQRRIILSTNVAETSITIPNIHYVIDSGKVRLSRYNPRNHIQGLQIEQISQASAKQRRGRCGRVAEGICVYLYSEKTLEESPAFTDPEIRRTSLAGVILQMAMLGLKKIENFPFIDPPQSQLIREGYQALRDINAINKAGEITQLGRKIAAMPLDPHLGKMLVDGYERHVLPEIIIITAFLSMQDPKERPLSRQAAADQAHMQWHDNESDFIGILNLWNFIMKERSLNRGNNAFKHFCRSNFLSFVRVREWMNLTQDLARAIGEAGIADIKILDCKLGMPDYVGIHKSILAGVPSNIGMYDSEEKHYIATRERNFYIFPGSALFRKKDHPKWVMTFALVSTTRVFARQVAEMESEWLEDVAPHLCKSVYENIKWDKQAGFVYATEMVTSGGLIISSGRRVHYGTVAPAEAREIFIRDAMVPGRMQSRHEWLLKHKQMIKDIKCLEEKTRRPDSIWDQDAVYEHFDKIIPEHICSVVSLEEWLKESNADINMDIEDAMILQLSPINEEDYPDSIIFSGHEFELRYNFDPGEPDDGVSILSRTEEMNLIPAWGLEWLVPGYLQEKVESMIKALPKEQRRACSPVIVTAEKFIEAVEEGSIFIEQSLCTALAEFLSEMKNEDISAEDFDMSKLPESMFMKIGEIDEDGYICDFHRELPEDFYTGSMLSAAVGGVAQWLVSELREWPEGDVPEKITLSEQEGFEAYPALHDDNDSVSRQVYMDKREAEYQHKRGIVRLFIINHAQQVKYLKKNYRLPQNIRMTLSFSDEDRQYEDDFLFAVISSAMTGGGDFAVRTAEEFEERSDEVLQEMAEIAQNYLDMLEHIFEKYEQIKSLLEKAGDRAEDECADVLQQLDFMFRRGFLVNENLWRHYPRYLRALELRAERINNAPHKDREKMQQILPFVERFRLALMAVDDFEKAFDLFDFWHSLQELRIATFAPEVQTMEKISCKRLQEKWDNLSL